MDKSKKTLLSVIFLAVVCILAVAVSFVLPQSTAETAETGETISTDTGDNGDTETIADETAPPAEETDEARIGPVSTPIRVAANDPHREATQTELKKYPQLTNLPTMYIELREGRQLSSIQKGVYIGASYTLVDNGYGIFGQPMQIAGRGNYSWSMSKKPYAIDLETDTDLLGMGAAKKWVLLANWSDKTLMRNYTTLSFSRQIGMEFAPECRYIDLYVNGEYHGNYVLVEKIQIDPQRVNIDTDIGALFEIEMTYRHSDCTYHISCPSGVHIMYSSPSAEDIGKEAAEANLQKFKVLFTKADIAIEKGYDYYSRYIDVDSFIDWYIINEFVKNYDSNFTTSCYCYVGNDGLIHMGPVWDYDTCMGNQNVATGLDPKGYHVGEQAIWYNTLLDDQDFFRLLSERWTELVDNGMLEWFFNQFTEIEEYFHDSEVIDHEKWTDALRTEELRGHYSTKTHADEVEYVVNWMSARYNWLCEQWYLGNDIPYRDSNIEEYFDRMDRRR